MFYGSQTGTAEEFAGSLVLSLYYNSRGGM